MNMFIIIPKKTEGHSHFQTEFIYIDSSKFIPNKTVEKIYVQLPKFKIANRIDFKEVVTQVSAQTWEPRFQIFPLISLVFWDFWHDKKYTVAINIRYSFSRVQGTTSAVCSIRAKQTSTVSPRFLHCFWRKSYKPVWSKSTKKVVKLYRRWVWIFTNFSHRSCSYPRGLSQHDLCGFHRTFSPLP